MDAQIGWSGVNAGVRLLFGWSGLSAGVRLLLPLLGVLLCAGCKESYRVGDYVLVEWCEGEYPAYVLERKGSTRYRVHFDGYESRWDSDVAFDSIKARLEAPPEPMPPLCDRVARALGIKKQDDDRVSPYEEGARVRVTWRGSVYKATVVKVVGPNRFKVHYDGHEASWDEVVAGDRIEGRVQ